MAFYKNVPDKHPKKHDYNQDSWEEEGSRYRNAGGRRFGPGADRDSDRPEHRGYGARPQGNRPERPYGRPQGDRPERPYGARPHGDRPERPYGRPQGDRPERPYGRPEREDRNFRPGRDGRDRDAFRQARQEERRPHRPPMPDAPRPSYMDREFRGPIAPASPAPMTAPMAQEVQLPPENLLSGRNPIREALKSGRDLEKLLVQRGELSGSAREIVQMAREAHVPVQEVEKARLDEITLHHQGMIAFASAFQYSSVEEMLELAAAKEEDPFLILLDGVTDPHNLGAVIRSAECVGAHGVIVPERRSVGLTPAAVKASAGAVEHVKVARVTNLNRTIEQLKKAGIWLYAVTMDGEDYEAVDFSGGCALVIGSEGEGISRLTLEGCDRKVSLPMAGELDSLNASVAAGVMMYRVFSCRRKK